MAGYEIVTDEERETVLQQIDATHTAKNAIIIMGSRIFAHKDAAYLVATDIEGANFETRTGIYVVRIPDHLPFPKAAISDVRPYILSLTEWVLANSDAIPKPLRREIRRVFHLTIEPIIAVLNR